jgi:hypothetical protein
MQDSVTSSVPTAPPPTETAIAQAALQDTSSQAKTASLKPPTTLIAQIGTDPPVIGAMPDIGSEMDTALLPMPTVQPTTWQQAHVCLVIPVSTSTAPNVYK